MKGGTFTVMMWKHLMVRLRRFIQTPIEFVSPALFFILLFLFKEQIIPPAPSFMMMDDGSEDIPETISLNKFSAPPLMLYYPDTAVTRLLMEAVGENLGVHIPAYVYAPLTNESFHGNFYDEVKDDSAVIIFHNMDGDEWPDKLNYTIRMKRHFYTDHYEPMDGNLGPHMTFGTEYESFMRLQWAIDTSYVKLLTGKNITQRVWVQEFPYYRQQGSPAIQLICTLLSFMCWMSLMLVFVFLTSRLLTERVTGIQELIKMVGVSSNTLVVSNFLNVLPAGLVYCTVGAILLKVTDNPLIPNSSGVLIFIMLLLHFISVVAMAFACSYLVNSTQYAVTVSVTAYVVLWLPARVLSERKLSRVVTTLCGVFPHVPMNWFWREVSALEQYGGSLSFSTMFSHHTPESGSVFIGFLLMVLQTMLFLVLSWYLSHVRPGQYGHAQPWNFLCLKQYWTKNEVMPDTESEEEAPIVQDAKYFEKPHKEMDVGIRITNVSKMYPNHKALSNVSLDVYKGEITVLLGHNGAGKTTLMSIITGMISATEGKVYVNGMETVAQQDAVRKQLGLCPQHNLFFMDLNVIEHVQFFTLLKGVSFREAHESSLKLLAKLGLSDKANNYSEQLSGGMKRRLQLACALAGDASVLVLDEPTSGLDVETRRELWDLLLSIRGSRTVMLTTHIMEEADALGDRVAALHAGRVTCHATPMYLKSAIGTGYRLFFTTIGLPKERAITSEITTLIPEASVKESTLNSISYSLPAQASNKFPSLFTTLEDKRSQLGIDSIGVGVSTLEEVFLKLCSDVDTTFTDDVVDGIAPESTMQKVSRPALYIRQMGVLLQRQFKYVLSKKMSFLLLQLFLPIVMIFIFTYTTLSHDERPTGQAMVAMNLDLYKEMPVRKVFYNMDTPSPALRTLHNSFPNVRFEETMDIARVVLRTSKQDALEYNKYLVGVEINDTDVKILYTTTVRHAAPVALNLLSNLLAQPHISWADGRTLTVNNQPIGAMRTKLVEPKAHVYVLMWANFIVFIFIATILNTVSLACLERASGARHIHIMSGCAPTLYWAATLLFQVVVCAGPLVAATILCAAFVETDHTIDQPVFLMMTVLIMLLGSVSFFAMMYLVSYMFVERVAAIVLVIFTIIFCLITPTAKIATEFVGENESVGVSDILLTLAQYLTPPHTLTSGLMKAGNVARVNAYCSLNKDMCPNLVVHDMAFDTGKCCVLNENPRCYFCFDEYSPAKDILILLAQFIVFMTLVILIQHGVLNGLYDRLFNARYRPQPLASKDDMVRAEAVYVDKQIELPSKQIPDSMLVNDVHKNYYQIIGKSCNAVKGISFSIKKGECFGLLGVNGAGKSTTFKMLTAEECATRGKIFANGHHQDKQPGMYVRSLGYCPQFSGLDPFLTGFENLTLLLTLRGLSRDDVTREANSWIQIVGLEKYAHRAVSGYSGGCSRRLGAAAALCAGAPLMLLDEPTAGVDVSARRRVWAALRTALQHTRSVIITSHSMDEMEALCGRIGIMCAGAVVALGSPPALRAAHGKGHAVLIKVKPTSTINFTTTGQDEVDNPASELNNLKGKLQETFDCTLKDEHKTMLHYHINETMRYSDLFKMLEELKDSFPTLIEDYSVTETTLEEVFLSFAEKKRDTVEATQV